MINKFKKRDLVIFAVLGLVFGFFIVRQFYAGREVRILIQPENNQILALEVAKLTKSNTELRQEVLSLDAQVNNYSQSLTNQTTANQTLNNDLNRYQTINGFLPVTGRGLVLKINQTLTQPQLVDLANTIRNIGVDGFSINGQRIIANSHFEASSPSYEVAIIGNPTLVKSALTRKSGYLDILFPSGTSYAISENDSLTLKQVPNWSFTYANIIN